MVCKNSFLKVRANRGRDSSCPYGCMQRYTINKIYPDTARPLETDFHSAFFVACATFLLFKLNSFSLHSTWKLRRQKKKVARVRQKKLNGNPPLSLVHTSDISISNENKAWLLLWDLRRQNNENFSLFRLLFCSWLMLGLWSYAYDDPYVAGFTSFLCFIALMFMLWAILTMAYAIVWTRLYDITYTEKSSWQETTFMTGYRQTHFTIWSTRYLIMEKWS